MRDENYHIITIGKLGYSLTVRNISRQKGNALVQIQRRDLRNNRVRQHDAVACRPEDQAQEPAWLLGLSVAQGSFPRNQRLR